MDKSDDIYSKESSSERSPWKTRGHRSSPRNKDQKGSPENKSGDERNTAGDYGRSSDRHLSRTQRKRKKIRKALLTIFLLGVACYAVYCAVVALQGFFEYKGISPEGFSIKNILADKKSSKNPGAKKTVPKVEEKSLSDIQSFIDRIQKSNSIQKDVQNLLDKGLAHQAIKRVEDSSGSLIKPSSLLDLLANANMMDENYSDAVNNYRELLERDPDNAQARIEMAAALLKLEQFKDAASTAEWAIEISPTSKEARTIAADSHMELGQAEKAIEQYKTIIEANPGNDKTRSKLAMAYYESGEYGRAVRYLNKMVEQNTNNSLAYYNLAVCYAKQMLVEKVVETLMRAERKFGRPFVRAWIQGEEFELLRDEPKFMLFTANLAKDPDIAKMKVRGDRQKKVSAELGTSPIQLDTGTDRLINRDR